MKMKYVNKKSIHKLAAVLLLVATGFTAQAQDKVISETELPASIRTYIKTHFAENEVLQATIDKGRFSTNYDVILSKNITLEFDSKDKIEEIKGHNSKLPDSVIPKSILDYVKKNYPNNFITEWDLDKGKQKIELDNGIDLEFTLKGRFLRIDN